jgi:hypothetical protein
MVVDLSVDIDCHENYLDYYNLLYLDDAASLRRYESKSFLIFLISYFLCRDGYYNFLYSTFSNICLLTQIKK